MVSTRTNKTASGLVLSRRQPAIPFRSIGDVEIRRAHPGKLLSALVTSVEGPLELNSHAREARAQACQGNIILDDDAYAPLREEEACLASASEQRNLREGEQRRR